MDTLTRRFGNMHRGLIAAAAALTPAIALAHPGDVTAHGFLAGLLHPWTGIDHIAAMLAAGLWATRLGARSMLTLLCATVVSITAGVALGAQHETFTLAEQITAASAVLLGFLVAVASTPRVPAAASLVALFCLFHGYVHAAETPEQFWQPVFTGGFVLSMLTLQLLGAAIAVLLSRRTMIVRSAGACCAVAGLIGLLLTN